MRRSEMTRLARTAAQLRPGQLGQRVRLRTQRAALEHGAPLASRWLLRGPGPESAVGWPASFTPLDAVTWRDWPGLEALLAGELSLLGVTRRLAPPGPRGAGLTGADWENADWTMAGTPLLWRFHLYYWDWAWSLAAAEWPERARRAAFAPLWQSWTAAVRPGRGPAWHPYPAALRAWSLCGVYATLVAGGPAEGEFRRELARHAGFLRRNLETDVGGNHLIKNLKALAGLAVFFGDAALLRRVLGRLRRQLAVQVLPDGGHYERAPAYHCQVLADLIDIDGLLRAAGAAGQADQELAGAIAAMRRWLGAVLSPAGDVPLLNDGFPVSRELLAALRPAPPPGEPLLVLPDSGLARATAGRWHLLADVGLPCPRELPAHAHADTLGCLVWVDAEPLLVDTGTSSYEAGTVRTRERSTAAHNTLEVDGADSTEVWGAFRAGRRARVSQLTAGAAGGTVTVAAAHDGYRRLRGRPAHSRRWWLRADELRVDDTVTGSGPHTIALRWHLAPDTQLRLVPGGALVTTKAGDFTVTVRAGQPGEPDLTAGTAEVAAGFGSRVETPVLTCVLHCQLPARVSTAWRPNPAPPQPNSQQEPA